MGQHHAGFPGVLSLTESLPSACFVKLGGALGEDPELLDAVATGEGHNRFEEPPTDLHAPILGSNHHAANPRRPIPHLVNVELVQLYGPNRSVALYCQKASRKGSIELTVSFRETEPAGMLDLGQLSSPLSPGKINHFRDQLWVS